MLASAYLPWAIIAFGVLLRVVRYAADRSLWLDEAYLALNLKSRSFGDLVGTLDFNQAAPPLFLFIEKAVMGVLGDGEYALRFFPFLAGVASMVLAYPVSRRYLSPAAAPIALFLFAVLEPFTFFGAEMKPYSSDILVTLVLLYLCARALDSETRAFPRWVAALAATGIVGVSLSYPSVFVLAGVAGAVLLSAITRKDRASIAWVMTSFGLILMAFVITFVVSIHTGRSVQASAASISGNSRSVVKNFYLVFTDPAGLPRTVVGLAAFVAFLGFVSILRRSLGRALLIAGCLATVFVAGLASQYAIGQRFLAFLLPLLALGLGEGIAALGSLRRPLAVAATAGVAVLLLAPPAKDAIERVATPPRTEEIVPLLQYIDRHWRPGDTIYLSPYAQYAFRYYLECSDCSVNFGPTEKQRWRFAATAGRSQTAAALASRTRALKVGTATSDPLDGYRTDAGQFAGRGRVWVLFTHYYPYDRSVLTAPFAMTGKQLDVLTDGVAAVYLYDFR